MHDPDRAHPPRRAADRHSQNGHQSPHDKEDFDDLPAQEAEEEEEPVTRRASRDNNPQEGKAGYEEDSPEEDLPYEDEALPPLPADGLPNALLYGLLAGASIAILNIIITYLNAPTYNAAAAQAVGKAETGLAGIIVGLWCLNIVISLFVCFGVGFLMGKTKIARRLGFYAGATAGAIMYIGSFVVNYIPNYPGHISSATSSGNPAAGMITSLAVLIIQGFIGGLFGLWGAWAATRQSPYYQER